MQLSNAHKVINMSKLKTKLRNTSDFFLDVDDGSVIGVFKSTVRFIKDIVSGLNEAVKVMGAKRAINKQADLDAESKRLEDLALMQDELSEIEKRGKD